ncbi:unnamed protein product [Camellia sinensis]
MVVNWSDFEESAEVTGWLDDLPDVVDETQLKWGPVGARISVVAGRAGDQNASPEGAGAKNFTQDLGILNTGIIEQPAVLTQFEPKGVEEFERIRKAKALEGTENAVCTRIENAESMWTESTVGIIVLEPDRCLLAADGMWWEDDDLCLAHTDEDWGSNQPDDTWYNDDLNQWQTQRWPKRVIAHASISKALNTKLYIYLWLNL